MCIGSVTMWKLGPGESKRIDRHRGGTMRTAGLPCSRAGGATTAEVLRMCVTWSAVLKSWETGTTSCSVGEEDGKTVGQLLCSFPGWRWAETASYALARLVRRTITDGISRKADSMVRRKEIQAIGHLLSTLWFKIEGLWRRSCKYCFFSSSLRV